MQKAEQENSVYILLTDTGTLFTKTIKCYTNAPYNHVSISFDMELDELYSFGRKHPRNPLKAGFVKEDVYRGTYRYFQNTRCALFKLAVTKRQLAEMKQTILYFQLRQRAYSYNFIGLFGIMINYPIESENAYFCSQFVAEVLKRSGVRLWDKSSALITPNEFLKHTSFQKVYEGKLYEYPLLQSELLVRFQPKRFKKRFLVFSNKKENVMIKDSR